MGAKQLWHVVNFFNNSRIIHAFAQPKKTSQEFMLPVAQLTAHSHSPKLTLSSPLSLDSFRITNNNSPQPPPPRILRSLIMSTPTAEVQSLKKAKIASDGNHRKTTPESPEKTPTTASIAGATPNANTDRKPRFQRVFSEEDEIHLLKGFLEITPDTPNPAMAAPMLYERVGKSLSGEINQTQLIEKLRKLRQKYTKQVLEKLVIKSPHEKEIFEISNKIWGENPSRRRRSSSKGSSNNKRVRKRKSSGDVPKVVGLPSYVAADNNDNKAYAAADATTAKMDPAQNHIFLMEEVNQVPGNSFMKQGLKCLDRAELGRLDENWRLQQIEEAHLSLQRISLIHEQTKLILEAIGN